MMDPHFPAYDELGNTLLYIRKSMNGKHYMYFIKAIFMVCKLLMHIIFFRISVAFGADLATLLLPGDLTYPVILIQTG